MIPRMEPKRPLTLLGCALALLQACSDPPASPAPGPASEPSPPADWPIYRGNQALHGVAPGSLPERPELAWTFETGGAITSSPVVAGGTVYVGSDDGSVHAVWLASGKKRWSYATGDIIEAPPLVLDGRVYVGSSDFFLYALDAATGKLAWKQETDDRILGGANWTRSPAGVTKILVGSYDNRLYCFDAASGEKLWAYETDNYVNGTPAVLGDRVVFGGCDAALHVVSASSGKAIARVELGEGCHVAGSVALAGNRVYLGHYGNEFACVDLDKARRRWSYPSPRHAFFSSPAIGRDRVVFGGRDKQLHCVKRSDGKPLWTFPTRRKVDGSPLICGDRVLFGSGDGRLYILALEDGRELWSYEIGQPLVSSPAVSRSMIVVGSHDKRLYAFKAASTPGR